MADARLSVETCHSGSNLTIAACVARVDDHGPVLNRIAGEDCQPFDACRQNDDDRAITNDIRGYVVGKQLMLTIIGQKNEW